MALIPFYSFYQMGSGTFIPAFAGIIISNYSSFPLQYVTEGSDSGYFFSEPIKAFQGVNNTIQPGYSGGIVHTKRANSVTNSIGYVSFRLRSNRGNLVVIMGWGSYRGANNRVGLKIRMQTDAAEPSGVINDWDEFLGTVHSGNDKM